MAQFLKPDNLNSVWASGGDRIYPGDIKYATGWQVEIPPRQYFNEIDYKQDQMLAHLNQHGIPVWDSITEYQADQSYVQGSDGMMYKAVTTNINIDPTTDDGSNWKELAVLGLATTAEARAQNTDSSLLSPLKLAEAFKGSNQSLGTAGYQKLPGGLIIQWGSSAPTSATTGTIPFPISFPNGVLFAAVTDSGASTPTAYGSWRTDTTTTSVLGWVFNTAPAAFSFLAIGY